MIRLTLRVLLITVLLAGATCALGETGNRLTYLYEFSDPYYPTLQTPKLITPQWVGEDGVEAVVILSIDDLGIIAWQKYEMFLRPILERLKQIDGRAPVSIICTTPEANEPHLQVFLNEGVSLEAHTLDHPCPLLQKSDFAEAKRSYDGCVDLLFSVPNNRPVAFRFPCMDGQNTPSPRAFAEIIARSSPKGKFLTISTSVGMVFTEDDPALPRELVVDEHGLPRFAKYILKGYVNRIEDYPYPYVVRRYVWEFPFSMPDDYEADRVHRSQNRQTVRDIQAAIDATVVKRGVCTVTFHPYDPYKWIRTDQILDVVEHALQKHGPKIKFVTFREVEELIDRNMLGGQPLRAVNGQDNGVRILDVNKDGYMDVVIGNENLCQTRIWSPKAGRWLTSGFPVQIVQVDADGSRHDAGVRFGVVRADGMASLIVHNERTPGGWHFEGEKWARDDSLLKGLKIGRRPILTSHKGADRGVRLRDLDGNGICELIVGNPKQNAVFAWDESKRRWRRLRFKLPKYTTIVTDKGGDAGLRFVDINGDRHDDVVFSNHVGYSLHLFTSLKKGWSRKVLAGPRQKNEIPMIVRADGTNNGVWFKYNTMCVQNEDTGGKLPFHVDSRSYEQLLRRLAP